MRPDLTPWIAASAMNEGVSKSGSPAPRLTMSWPSSTRLLAKVLTAIVAEGLRLSILALKDMTLL